MSFAIVVTGLMLLMVVAVFVWWCASYSKASPAAEASLNQEEESIGVGAIDHPIETFKVRKLHNKELEDTLINNKVYGWTTFSKQPYTLLFRENNDFIMTIGDQTYNGSYSIKNEKVYSNLICLKILF